MQYPFKVPFGTRVAAFFRHHQIWLSHPFGLDDVFPPGGELLISAPTLVEPNATMPKRRFFGLGAFSYSISALPNATSTGRYCSISWNCSLMGIQHPVDRISTHVFAFRPYWQAIAKRHYGDAPTPAPFKAELPPIEIGDDVWIGQDVLMKPGIKIGHGAIIAARAVITKDVPPFAIMGGVPARLLRYRFPEALQQRILASRWWDYHVRDFGGLDTGDTEAFLDGLAARVESGAISPYAPGRIDLAPALRDWMAAGVD